MIKKLVSSASNLRISSSLTLFLVALTLTSGIPRATLAAGPTTDLEAEAMEPPLDPQADLMPAPSQDAAPVESPVFEMLQNEPSALSKSTGTSAARPAAPLIERQTETQAQDYHRWASDPLSAPGSAADDNALSRDVKIEPLEETPAPVVAEEVRPAPARRPEPTVSKVVVPKDKAARAEVLENPTRSIETYEKTRREHMWEKSEPDWSFNLGLAPRAYRNAELRVATATTGSSETKPRLTGLLMGGERVLLHNVGQVSLGGEFGLFGNTPRNQFSGLLSAVMTLGPYVAYRAQFFARQLVVPTIKAGYELQRINYTYAGTKVQDMRTNPRVDLGAMLYLNFLEPSSAGLMQSNYGIKRTYLTAFYSIAPDSSKKDVNLSESGAWRAGFRFEF